MKINTNFISVAACLALLITSQVWLPETVSAQLQKDYPGAVWSEVQPEELGWSTEKLNVAQTYAESIGALGDVVVVDGKIIAQWGDVSKVNRLNSVRKSFLSALYGIYVDQGKINLQATLGDYGVDDYPLQLTEQEKSARVVDLLEARSGVYHVAAYETNGMVKKRPERGSHAPGQFWYYNNWDFNALGTIFEHQTGISIFEAFKTNIADPLQMEDYKVVDQIYHSDPRSTHRAYIFQMSTRDMARFGLLYLRNGEWNGHQIVPRHWITESTTAYTDVGDGRGYGYLWWVSVDNKLFGAQLAGSGYYAHGHDGQIIVVVPYLNLVIAHTTPRGHDTAHEFETLFRLIMEARPNSSVGT